MSVGLRMWRRRGPRQVLGDLCGDCGAVLVSCVQCGAHVRCLVCCPYERPSAGDAGMHATVRAVRDHPELGLLAGALAALVPAVRVWAGMSFARPGVTCVVGTLAGALACCCFLGAGAAWGTVPLRGEVSPCRVADWTPYDRRALAGCVALGAQVALLSIGIAIT